MSKKTNVSTSKRRDDKGRLLRMGEYQRKDGRYVYKYKDCSGQVRCLYASRLESKDPYLGGRKRLPALRELEEEILQNQWNGVLDFGGDITVLELAERYVETRQSVRESTRAGYKTVLNILRNDPFGKIRIDKVKLSDAKLWILKLNKDGRRYSSIHNIRGVLRPAFNMALEDDLIRKNPFEFPLGSVVADDSKKREALTPEQEEAFLNFVKEDQHFGKYYDGIYILLNTGLRISEFCGLTPEDVDYEKECIHVRGQLVRPSNMITAYEPTKTASGVRDVPMSEEVMECFRRIVENRKKPLVEPEVDGKTGFYWLDKDERPLLALHWEHYFKRIVDKYNNHYTEKLPRITPHVCRHTFCSKMARRGMNAKNLQYIMGHSEIGITLDTYTHLSFSDAASDFKKCMKGA
jgi:integrase